MSVFLVNDRDHTYGPGRQDQCHAELVSNYKRCNVNGYKCKRCNLQYVDG